MKPKLFITLKEGYNGKKLLHDLTAGLIVGIVALPLAIAFAIASGVSPEKGLITAVIAGFIMSAMGGSRVQIGGPTGAFVIIVSGVIAKYGINGLIISTIIAGVLLIIMGFARLGSIIKFIPFPLIVGFTAGIAVIIFSTQIKDLFGMSIANVPSDFIPRWGAYFQSLNTINWYALGIGIGSIIIVVYWKKITEKIPGSLVAIVAATLVVYFFQLPVETIGKRFGGIPFSLSAPVMPTINLQIIKDLISPAVAIALLAGIESLLSAVVADGMINAKHDSNMELVANGVANVASGLFGGIPATGAIARTATNIKNGGRTPIAGMTHAVVLFIIVLFFGNLAALIPMPCLAAILVVVAYNMSEWRVFKALLKSPKSDIVVLLTTFFLTVIIDLVVAIEVGMILAVFLFIRRMAHVTDISVVTREFDESGNQSDAEEDAKDPYSINKMNVPHSVEVYEIKGPFFFGAAEKFKEAMRTVEKAPKIRIIRMRHVPAIDSSGLKLLEDLFNSSKKNKIDFIISGINPQPLDALEKSGLLNKIGKTNVHSTIDKALVRAEEILAEKAAQKAS